MDEERVAISDVEAGQYERRPLHNGPDVADRGGIEERVDDRSVVGAELREPTQSRQVARAADHVHR